MYIYIYIYIYKLFIYLFMYNCRYFSRVAANPIMFTVQQLTLCSIGLLSLSLKQ